MNTGNRKPAVAAGAAQKDEGGSVRMSCDVCLAEIPADAVNVTDTQDYVHHFCGLGCFEVWKKQAGSPENDVPPESANRLK